MLFLSTFTNKIDKKGRVSVPANFRAAVRKEEFQGVVAFASFVNECIEVSPISRIEQISDNIDAMDPYSEERDAFATAILGESFQLAFDTDGRVMLPELLLERVKLTDKALFIGKGKTFEIWDPAKFTTYADKARELAKEKRYSLKMNKINQPTNQEAKND
jgi:MraZ protein